MAYGADDVPLAFLYMHGGIAILVYTAFYYAIFGPDEVRWMYINAALGVYGVMAQIDLLLALVGKSVSDYTVAVHIIPFAYYVLYTFLLRQMVLDVANARDDEVKRNRIDNIYVGGSIAVYSVLHLIG